MFNRINLIQYLINKTKATRYLEIGVFKGFSFLKIYCKKKIGVDPNILITKKKKLLSCFKNFTNINNIYYEMTSNDFFIKYTPYLQNKSPNVIFIDGLHTFTQSLTDVINSLNIINHDGYIVMHDCIPPTEASSTPAFSIEEAKTKWLGKNTDGWNDEWCGDVWKTIIYLKDNYKDLKIHVINADYGLGVIQKTSDRKYKLSKNINPYKKLDFSYINNNYTKLLSMIEVEDIPKILNND